MTLTLWLSAGSLLAALAVFWWRGERAFTDSRARAGVAVAVLAYALALVLVALDLAAVYAFAGAIVATVAAALWGWRAAPGERAPVATPSPPAPAPAPVPEQGHDSAAEQRLNDYMYMVSHDLQEPLRMVTGFTQLLERRYADRFDEQGREFLRLARESASRLSAMLAELLRLSRLERQSVQPAPVDLASVLETTLNRLKQPIMESNAKIVADPLPRVLGVSELLEVVFAEIIANSMRFRGEAAPRIHVAALRQDKRCVVEFRDNGQGFEQRFAERVLKPFQRLHPSEAYPGTGMGLALARRALERMGGEIEISSEPGKGTRVRVALRCAAGLR